MRVGYHSAVQKEVYLVLSYMKVRKKTEDFTDFPAPWEVYPEDTCGSIHWRMGAGESAMIEWWKKFGELNPEQRLEYGRMHDAPPEWGTWLERVRTSISKEADHKEIARVVLQKSDEVLLSCVFDSNESARVETAKVAHGEIEGSQVFRLRRGKDGWEIQN